MEKVWNSLHIPDGMKLDMAIKYSSECYMDNLEEVKFILLYKIQYGIMSRGI